MGVVALLIALALLAGGVGLLIEGLRWALIIAAVLVLGAGLLGFRSGAVARGRVGRASRA
jgi:hypothetical protein